MGAPERDTGSTRGADGMQIGIVKKTGDPFVDRCFAIDFDEQPDPRDFQTIDVLRRVAELGNEGEAEKALELLDTVCAEYADFDFVYGWKGMLLARLGRLDEARQAIVSGLEAARSKSALCEDLGTIEFEAGRLDEAIVWWMKSVLLQILSRTVDSMPPFIYLAEVADVLAEPDTARLLLDQADAARPERVRLTPIGRHRVNVMVARHGDPSMKTAMRLLGDEFLKERSHRQARR